MSAAADRAPCTARLRRAAARGRWCRDGIEATEAFSRGDDLDRDWMGWGALRVLSRQAWAPGAGRDDGRVANMERIVLVLDGTLDVDCGGLGRRRVQTGGALWIGAGHGVESRLANASPRAPLRLLECWLQPDRVNAVPALGLRAAGTGSAAGTGAWATLAAAGPGEPPPPSADGHAECLPLRQQARLLVACVDEGQSLALPSGKAGRYWLEVLDGMAVVNGADADGALARGTWTGARTGPPVRTAMEPAGPDEARRSPFAGTCRLDVGDGLGWLAGSAAAPATLQGAGPGTARLLLFELPA